MNILPEHKLLISDVRQNGSSSGHVGHLIAVARWWVMAGLVVPMEVRFAIGALVVLDDVPRGAVSRLCREYGISRDTFYRYRAQLDSEGLAGLLPKSRRPHRSPNATPPEVVQLLVAKHHELVAQGWDGGARSVRSWLRLAGIGQIPSARTVHKILAAHGCVEASAAGGVVFDDG